MPCWSFTVVSAFLSILSIAANALVIEALLNSILAFISATSEAIFAALFNPVCATSYVEVILSFIIDNSEYKSFILSSLSLILALITVTLLLILLIWSTLVLICWLLYIISDLKSAIISLVEACLSFNSI